MGSEADMQATGRKYRSKKQRPCDLCRSRKIHCQVPTSESVCECCKRLNRTCTFELEPLKKRMRPDESRPMVPASAGGPLGASPVGPSAAATVVPHMHHLPLETPMATQHTGVETMALDGQDFWLYGGMSGYTSPGSLAGFNQLLMQSPTNLAATERHTEQLRPDHRIEHTEPGFSPPSGTERANHMCGFQSGGDADGGSVGITTRRLQSNSSHVGPLDSTGPDPDEDAFSLERRPGYSHHFIGLSCETDPYLLRYYEYDKHDLYAMFRLDYRRMQDEEVAAMTHGRAPRGYAPVQFALTDERVLQDGVREMENVFAGDHRTEADDLELVNALVPADLGERLIRLYARCVHPRFPVLALRELGRIRATSGRLGTAPVGLLSAVYALAMPFTFLDDELSLLKGYLSVPTDDLWEVAFRSYTRASGLSHLALLQLCLLLLQRPPYNAAVAAPPRLWALSCAAVALAETLGLNLDPTEWQLPRSEAVLRRRLWWLTYTQHVWFAVGLARPCHIQASHWDVNVLTADDLEGAADDFDKLAADDLEGLTADDFEAMAAEAPILLAHCLLSLIAADVLKEFYTLRSVRQATSLSVLLTRAQPLRTRIESWRQTLPLLSKPTSALTEDDLVVGASLRLAHLTLEVLIFRALLRPLAHDAVPIDASGVVPEPVSTIHENSYTCARAGIEMVGFLKGKHFSAFWPPYARYQLCYISNFLLLSLAQAPTVDMATRYHTLLNRWRDTLRSQARVWPLARLATIRLDAIFWKGLPSVLAGAGDSPALMLATQGKQRSQPGTQRRRT